MSKHEDARGIIEDLKVGPDWSVTYITFTEGAVRGNHYHKETEQEDFILEGEVLLCLPYKTIRLEAGESYFIKRNMPHAYKAVKPSKMVSVCHGKRVGENYESDTFRLEKPLV